jgi:hypothetical protein
MESALRFVVRSDGSELIGLIVAARLGKRNPAGILKPVKYSGNLPNALDASD